MLRLLLLFCSLVNASTAVAGSNAVLAREVVQELNRARTEPAQFVQYLQQHRAAFQGAFYLKPGSPVRYRTQEGVAAVKEAEAFLESQSPLPPLQWSSGLTQAAGELAMEQEQNGAYGHGQGTSDMEGRIERHGEWTVGYAENVVYGDYQDDSAREVVLQMLIDDGIPERGHRLNIFSKDYRLVGVACGPHPLSKAVCVIDFAGGVVGEEGR